ncbi:MAG: hypothetical protein IPJ65_27440 [Archangiaceae bacterium]|nr:hypothetical protein [Archangiaceae bacterium]
MPALPSAAVARTVMVLSWPWSSMAAGFTETLSDAVGVSVGAEHAASTTRPNHVVAVRTARHDISVDL